jgi:hypothetical protein
MDGRPLYYPIVWSAIDLMMGLCCWLAATHGGFVTASHGGLKAVFGGSYVPVRTGTYLLLATVGSR